MGAGDHSSLVDFCNRSDLRAHPLIVRTPLTAFVVAHERSCVHPDLSVSAYLRVACNSFEFGQLRFPGSGVDQSLRLMRRPAPRSLAKQASPQPDRLRHLSSFTRDTRLSEFQALSDSTLAVFYELTDAMALSCRCASPRCFRSALD